MLTGKTMAPSQSQVGDTPRIAATRYVTKECLLWLDDATKKQCRQPERVHESAAQAAAYFLKKYGTPPAVIYVCPASAAEQFLINVDGAKVLVIPKRGTLFRTYRVCKEIDPNDKS